MDFYTNRVWIADKTSQKLRRQDPESEEKTKKTLRTCEEQDGQGKFFNTILENFCNKKQEHKCVPVLCVKLFISHYFLARTLPSTISLNFLPAVNTGAVLAAILIVAPV